MKIFVVDTENTIFQKGNPFAQRNRCCYLGLLAPDIGVQLVNCLNGEVPPTELVCDLIVGFNLKYDLHWLRRLGIKLPPRVWCCQAAHFLLNAQRTPYPSLDGVAAHYGLAAKLTGPSEYWSRGIDTDAIPVDVMLAYLEQDLRLTWEVYQKQQGELARRPELRNLMRLTMDDLLVLQDMEWNGLRLNVEECERQAEAAHKRLDEIEAELRSRYPNTPVNWDSPEHLSAYLYGGTIKIDRREPVGLFKTGAKTGQVRYRHVEDVYVLERLVEPPEGSDLKKKGVWSTAEDILKNIKQLKEVKLLLERSTLSKLLDYLDGFPELVREKDWKSNELHGQFNQVVARTGRLSSSNPNLQNLPDPVLKLIETRYGPQESSASVVV